MISLIWSMSRHYAECAPDLLARYLNSLSSSPAKACSLVNSPSATCPVREMLILLCEGEIVRRNHRRFELGRSEPATFRRYAVAAPTSFWASEGAIEGGR